MTTTAFDRRIGLTVRAMRQGSSQQWVAEQMRIKGHAWAQTIVVRTEKGERPLRLAEAVDLADVLGVTVDRLLYVAEALNY